MAGTRVAHDWDAPGCFESPRGRRRKRVCGMGRITGQTPWQAATPWLTYRSRQAPHSHGWFLVSPMDRDGHNACLDSTKPRSWLDSSQNPWGAPLTTRGERPLANWRGSAETGQGSACLPARSVKHAFLGFPPFSRPAERNFRARMRQDRFSGGGR